MENKTIPFILGVGALVLAILAGVVAVKAPTSISIQNGAPNVSVKPEAPSEETLGANAWETTNLISLELSDDLSIGDDLTVTGDLNLTGNALGSVVYRPTVTMTTATTTPCAIQNTTGSDRILAAISGVWTSTAGAGTVGLSVGTSTNQYTAGTPKLISNATFANSASADVVSTTSTLQSAYAIWQASEWLVWNTTTSTNAGTCSAIAF